MKTHNLVLNNNFSNREENSLKNCFKCSSQTSSSFQIKRNLYWLCYKCYRYWIAIKSKYYQLAVKEFLEVPEGLKENDHE